MMRNKTSLYLFVVSVVMVGMVSGAFGQTTYVVNPGESIQVAIDGAVYGDTVSVAEGTYPERITLKNGVAVVGAGADLTTINGEALGTVVTAVDCDPNTVLEGFTITNGQSLTSGGGMYNENSSPTVTGCTFSDNEVIFGFNGSGGGMYNYSSSPRITGCTFSGNRTFDGGGGISNENSNPI
ncbi:MAG: hypothetical protein GY869_03195, partial [Planctomycetes bacterium]|nr:hypothetical protein [Planctomycetota bacterium]